jgi:hypothetical protein
MAAIRATPFVDRDRVVIGGQSRGGLVSVAYVGQHPEQVKGGPINLHSSRGALGLRRGVMGGLTAG